MTTKVTVFNHGPKNIRVYVLPAIDAQRPTGDYNSKLIQPGIGDEFLVHQHQILEVQEREP